MLNFRVVSVDYSDFPDSFLVETIIFNDEKNILNVNTRLDFYDDLEFLDIEYFDYNTGESLGVEEISEKFKIDTEDFLSTVKEMKKEIKNKIEEDYLKGRFI